MASNPPQSTYANRPGVGANQKNLPKHVAIIMDGNGRWATARKLSRTAGHRQGIETVRNIIEHSLKSGVKVLTLFTFGQENWRRPAQEVRNLHRLFLIALNKEVGKLHENGVRLKIIGDKGPYTDTLKAAMHSAENRTRDCSELTLNLAINYSGRWDLLNAVKKLSEQVKANTLQPDEIDEAHISACLCLHELPEPDLFIRTGGVQRLSNFMLWEMAYTELFFTETHWPDFSVSDYQAALDSFAQRERRFGLTSQQIEGAAC